MTLRALASLLMLASLAACGGNAARYLVDTPAPAQQVRVRVATVEVRDVTLPAYAAASEIMVQQPDGSLRPVSRSIWADDPVHAVTASVARGIAAGSTATAMSEPWPLDEPAQVRTEIRIERMVAQSDGQFRLAGQFSIASPDRIVRESIDRFDILRPMADDSAASVADATGAALLALSQQIVARLR